MKSLFSNDFEEIFWGGLQKEKTNNNFTTDKAGRKHLDALFELNCNDDRTISCYILL